MSFIDTIARAQASNALSTYGKAATLNKIAAGAYDLATGAVTNTTTAYAVQILIENYAQGLVDGTIIKQGDIRATMPALNNQTPAPGDDLVFGSTTHKVVAVESVYSGDLVAIFIMQVRV